MLSIISKTNDAWFNLATEEYLLKHKRENCFYLYINSPSIIVGKHQNTLSEINYEFVKAHNIKIVRRMTGGGSVFHDLGNLNYCFIMDQGSERTDNFETYTRPVLQVLRELGLDAHLEGRNDLVVNGKKFSGNAKLTWKNKVLQHGTILFSSSLMDISEALNPKEIKFQDKAVKSVSSRVTNISELLPQPMELTEFVQRIRTHVHSLYPEAQDYEFTKEEEAFIQNLVETKYSTWEWNFGKSPTYNFSKTIRTNAGTLEFYLEVLQGKIVSLKIFGDFFPTDDPAELEELLTGLPHKEEILRKRLSEIDLSRWFTGVTPSDILSGLF